MERDVSSYLVRLRREHPFLATLSLYVDYRFADSGPQFETDGRVVRINSNYFSELNTDQRIGTLMHLTLHAALLHPVRRGPRLAEIWNIAADIVVNGIIADTQFDPPPDTAVEPRYAGLSVEQVYGKLLNSGSRLTTSAAGKKKAPSGDEQPDGQEGNSPPESEDKSETGKDEPTKSNTGSPTPGKDPSASPDSDVQSKLIKTLQTLYPATADLKERSGSETPGAKAEQKRLEAYWKRAMTRAKTVEQLSSKTQGDLPAGLEREIDQVLNPQLDWRIILWRFMSKTPCDYAGFDRRFIHQGLYLDHLESESLTVHIAMDTSGSIEPHELAQFRAEIETIVRCYSSIDAQLYFVDAAVYGPYPLTAATRVDRAEGGGGTDFSVFFDQLDSSLDPFAQTLCVYLTDGFGAFPKAPPTMPVLWVVANEGSDEFPFGEIARLAY